MGLQDAGQVSFSRFLLDNSAVRVMIRMGKG